MTAAADLVLTNAEVHTLAEPDRTHEAVAVRDGRIVGVGDSYDVEFLAGAETRVVDLDGRVLLPGFVDAHTHMETTGRYLVHADLSGAGGPDEAVARLADRAAATAGTDDEWVLGFGYDESAWDERRYLTRTDLDAVSETRPVAAFREDLHVASLNAVALDRHREAMPAGDVRTADGEPTGVVVEGALEVVSDAVAPDRAGTRRLLEAAQARANERGVTGVHDMVRRSHAPSVYRELAREGSLTLRVRLNYWSDHLDALSEVGLRTNDGGGMVRTGAIKTFTDGSIGARTAKLSRPYDDADPDEDGDGDGAGQWVVPPEDLAALVRRADEAGFQVAAHAIGDEAVAAALDAVAALEDPGDARHRIEHAELATDGAIERAADLGVVASLQPNFHKWAVPGGLYASRLGDRRTETNRLGAFRDAGVPLAFGSDCMPLDPLLGVHHAVTAPAEAQRVGVTEALRAYTLGAAYAGFDEDRLGTVETGKRADLVALDASPWEHRESIREIEAVVTVVDGRVVYDDR
jgi:hypothetical protein